MEKGTKRCETCRGYGRIITRHASQDYSDAEGTHIKDEEWGDCDACGGTGDTK